MSKAALCALLLMLVGSSAAFAQVIYTPVQYQFFAGGRAYYYGGTDPSVHADFTALSSVPGYGRTGGYAFQSGDLDRHREVTTERAPVFTDSMPGQDARQFGFTPQNAANEALANSPTYFRKADVVRMARVEADGTWTVPANATPASGTIDIRPMRPAAPAMRTVEPKPILIIPKRLLDKPLWPKNNQTADAR
jgi:hypothetical protein